ncbi:pentatricopeptide repeat-containing protein At1g06143-like [Magnolia sinica]|uniref:pentatricopeptide repeat-containing protein At1g06143-like n=1 Tax=Magnolia sinica TaxID=86752 RepID=UPI002658AC49|nr:pentatricopeptide repeat-containing protein At1g06143-like [Magnolia sinica]
MLASNHMIGFKPKRPITNVRFSGPSEVPTRLLKTPETTQIPTSNGPEAPTVSLLWKCSQLRELKSAHATMIKNNAHQDPYLINQFIGACSAFRRMHYALLVFHCMEDPNVYVYNAMIRGFVHCSSPIQALRCYVGMSRSRVSPTSFTFSTLVKACTQALSTEFGESIHGRIWKSGFQSQVFVQTSLIDFYSNCSRIVESRKVFDGMTERDVVSWTTMVSGYARVGDLDAAGRLFEDMPERSTVSWNTMIAGFARSGDVESAARLFDQMPSKDLVSWTTMISSYSQGKRFREALEVFQAMRVAGVSPDEVTMATVISACAHLGALDLGKEMHFYALQNGFDLDVYIGSALVDMYAKCGNIERSLVVFFNLREKNLFCWNSMIEGLAIHGHAGDALGMFDRMERQKVKPNGVTFVSVLSACTHAGLVEEGRRRFSSMTHDYLISPEIKHYGCMVDLLGRAGLLKEAYDLIMTMSIEPNAVVWGALLGGCKLHGNLEIGKIAVEELMILEPENSGYYVLLVNMYAEANRWSEVAKIRAAMRGRGVQKKSPGSSWIEVGGKVHEFVVADRSHPLCDKIFMLLVELDGQLKMAGI